MKKTILLLILALLGMTQAVAQEYEYLPFVREGVKWVYYIENYNYKNNNTSPDSGDDVIYRTLEFKGDTVINGKTYKKLHKYSGNAINEENDTVPIYLREEDKVVYGVVPDGKFYNDCPIYCAYYDYHDSLAAGKECVLYDFLDPVSYWDRLTHQEWSDGIYTHLYTDMLAIGNHLVKRYVGRIRREFEMIEGIGLIGANSYPLGFFIPMSTDGFPLRYGIEKVVEDGEVIYPQNYSDDEYVPFVREGVKWVYYIKFYHFDEEHTINPAMGNNTTYRTLELKGDTVINGKTYKKMHKYSGDAINLENDTVPIYLREEDRIVYGFVPDGRYYDDSPIHSPGKYIHGMVSDEEFVLYDFQDPITYWQNLSATHLYTDTIAIGQHLAKRYVCDYPPEFWMIEGIGVIGINTYPLGVLMELCTGANDISFGLEKVVENGEVIYPQDFVEDRYLPIIRDGVKWVNERVSVIDGDTTCCYYSYYFNGNYPAETRLAYKAIYCKDESRNGGPEVLISGMNESESLVLSLENDALARIYEEGRFMMIFDTTYEWDWNLLYSRPITYLYWFNGMNDNETIEYYKSCQREQFLNEENFVLVEPIMIDGVLCGRCAYLDDDGEVLAYVVEGIGFDSRDMGDLLTPFTSRPDPTAAHQEWCGLSHVVKDGEIIYKGMRWHEGTTTGIDEAVIDRSARPLDPHYYNLMGQPVGTDVPTAPGIYIHQGKKILVR